MVLMPGGRPRNGRGLLSISWRAFPGKLQTTAPINAGVPFRAIHLFRAIIENGCGGMRLQERQGVGWRMPQCPTSHGRNSNDSHAKLP